MGWARLDDGFHDHPKVDGLSLAAVGLYTLCLTWAHRHRRRAALPGHVPASRVVRVAGRQADRLAAELVQAKLWEHEEGLGGYLIHDFGDYLPKERDPEERKEAGRKGAASRWQGDGKLPSTDMASDGSRASAPAFPTRPVPKEQEPAAPPAQRSRDELFEAVAEVCGYHDKAHLGHEFRAMSGLTPGRFSRARHDSLKVPGFGGDRQAAMQK